VLAARLVLRHWWSVADAGMSTMDPPERLLAAAVATLPERRREWGRAMSAELAEVEGRSARWRFALSSVWAMLWMPLAGGRLVIALVTAVVVAATTAAGPAVGAAVPGLRAFAVAFTGLVGAMVVLAVVRSRRPRLPAAPAPTVLVTAGVAASIAVTVIFLRREPAAAQYLPLPAAVYLAVALAGCLRLAAASPRWLGTNRLAPHVGAAAAVVFATWFWLVIRLDGADLPLPLVLLLAPVLPLTPIAAFFVPAFTAGRAARSLRSGLLAAVWTVAAVVPLTFAVWLPEALRRHAIDGRLLDGEVAGPVGRNLTEAMIFCLGIFPVLGLVLGVIGAALGARRAHPAAPDGPDGPDDSTDPSGAVPSAER
jgi:multisubunit Na+/H+ antiporter MnhB subunit